MTWFWKRSIMAAMQRIKLKGANVETSRSVRRLLQHAMQEMVVAWIGEWLSERNGEKWSDLRYLLKVERVWFAGGLNVEYERKSRVKGDTNIYGLSSWGSGGMLYLNEPEAGFRKGNEEFS